MKRLLFILSIVAVFATGCDNTKPEQTEPETEPVELKLDYNGITLGEYSLSYYYPDKLVSYSKIIPEGYQETILILQGNGGYKLTKTHNTADSYPKSCITTEAMIVDNNSVVITIKGLLPEEATQENWECFVCYDDYLVTDSEGESQYIHISSFWIGGPPL